MRHYTPLINVAKNVTFEKVSYGGNDFDAYIIADNKIIEEVTNKNFGELPVDIDKMLNNASTIEILCVFRPLGREYGNYYAYGIKFRNLGNGLYRASFYRMSDTYCAWSDIGMTGSEIDKRVIVRKKICRICY